MTKNAQQHETDNKEAPVETMTPEQEAEIAEAAAGVAPKKEPTIEDDLIAAHDRIKQLEDQLLRTMADLENFRKRSQKEMDDTRKYAASNFAKDMIDVLENLGRALQSVTAEQVQENETLNTLYQGVEMTYNNLMGAFSRHQVQRIEPVDQPFDHNFHQAVARKETADVAPNTVTNVLHAGYTMHDRLLRPAMVEVATAPSKNDNE